MTPFVILQVQRLQENQANQANQMLLTKIFPEKNK